MLLSTGSCHYQVPHFLLSFITHCSALFSRIFILAFLPVVTPASRTSHSRFFTHSLWHRSDWYFIDLVAEPRRDTRRQSMFCLYITADILARPNCVFWPVRTHERGQCTWSQSSQVGKLQSMMVACLSLRPLISLPFPPFFLSEVALVEKFTPFDFTL